MKMVYLAAPYTPYGVDEEQAAVILEERIAQVCNIDAQLFARGVHAVTPLYKHFVSQLSTIATDWTSLEDYCYNLLDRCDALYVIMLDGWEESSGVQGEIVYAKKHKIQIVYCKADGSVVKVE